MRVSLCVTCCLFALSVLCEAFHVPNTVPLDSFVFDRIVSESETPWLIKVTIVHHETRTECCHNRFDKKYNYDEREEEFKKVANSLRGTQDLLIGVVGVGEHDPEKLNKSLLSRFGVSPDSFPTYKLFMGGNRGSKPVEPIPYLGEIKHGDILQFVTQHTKIRVSLPGCLKEFDSLVDKFMAGDSGQKLTIRREAMKVAETFVTSGRSEEDQQIGKYYVLIMKKVLERGDDFVAKEKARLSKILEGGALTKEKAALFKTRLNILPSFDVTKEYKEL